MLVRMWAKLLYVQKERSWVTEFKLQKNLDFIKWTVDPRITANFAQDWPKDNLENYCKKICKLTILVQLKNSYCVECMKINRKFYMLAKYNFTLVSCCIGFDEKLDFGICFVPLVSDSNLSVFFQPTQWNISHCFQFVIRNTCMLLLSNMSGIFLTLLKSKFVLSSSKW